MSERCRTPRPCPESSQSWCAGHIRLPSPMPSPLLPRRTTPRCQTQLRRSGAHLDCTLDHRLLFPTPTGTSNPSTHATCSHLVPEFTTFTSTCFGCHRCHERCTADHRLSPRLRGVPTRSRPLWTQPLQLGTLGYRLARYVSFCAA